MMPEWDLEWLRLINQQWTHPTLDYVMAAVSAIEAWIPLIVIGVLAVAWRGRAKAL